MKYVAYYRTSTKDQNLGIAAQKAAVHNFLKIEDELIAEYTEQESGKKNDRKELARAIEHCERNDSILLIAKLDRLSRNLTFISQLMDKKTKFMCCDMPTANTFTVHVLAAVSQQEREMISSRTIAALAELKKQGVALGRPQNLTNEARAKGVEAIKLNAIEANKQVVNLIDIYRNEGKTLQEIANKLNQLSYKTRTGKSFSRSTVKILYDTHLRNKAELPHLYTL